MVEIYFSSLNSVLCLNIGAGQNKSSSYSEIPMLEALPWVRDTSSPPYLYFFVKDGKNKEEEGRKGK